jgi:phosphonate transport system substrate-binding protein
MNRVTALIGGLYLVCVVSMLLTSLDALGRSAPALQADNGARKLRVSLPRVGSRDLGTKDVGKIFRDGQSLVRYLEKETGAQVEMTVPMNYASVVEAMAKNQVDVAYLGGLEFVQASARGVVRPLVQRVKDKDWHTVFITQSQLNIHSLKDLSGHSFAMAEPASVSSRVMPEYWMREAKVDTKIIANAFQSGRHEETALAVANRKVDTGALDREVYREMMRDGKITAQQVRVFWEGPPYADPVWAARKELDSQLASSFANAFLKLDAKNPDHQAILVFLSADKYIRAEDSYYDLLRKAAQSDGLLK